MKKWIYVGKEAKKIVESERAEIQQRAQAFAKTRPWNSKFELQLRFRGKFCYVDSIQKKDQFVSPLCRLQYYDKNEWSMAFYTYSNDRYEECWFPNGKDKGTLEEAIKICEMYLH